MIRRTLAFTAAVLLGLVVAGTAYWHYAAARLGEGIAVWAEERRAEGMDATYSSLEVTGFPWLLRASVRDPVLARPERPAAASGQTPGEGDEPAWAWRGSELVAAFRPWRPRTLDLRFPGTHQITLPLDEDGWTVFAAAARASGTLDLNSAGAPESGVFRAEDLDLVSEDGGASLAIARGNLAVFAYPPGAPRHLGTTLDLTFTGEDLDLPPDPEPPLGRRISTLQATLSLLGVLPPGPLAEAAAEWRRDGGTVELHRLYLDWGPLEVEAGGTLALDAELQPMGALTATIRGFAETIDALVAKGLVKARDGATAKVVLGLLAKEPEGGGAPEVTVPLTVQNGRLYVGPVVLFRLPKVPWG